MSKPRKVRQSLGGIACAAQASLLGWEEGIIVHEAIGALSEGRILMDLTFRRRTVSARSSRHPDHDSRAGARRSRKRPGWGIQEGHLKRLIILSR
jgi:hypothetical protein